MSDKASLEELGLSKDQLEGAEFDQIPENLGQSYPDPPQPGRYRFKFPPLAKLKTIFSKITTEKHGERISAAFEDDAALTIVQSPDGSHNGEEYRFRVSNVPRERTKEKILVSDMDLLLRAKGVTQRPKTNAAYGQALIKAVADQEVSAEVEFSYSCNPNREIYVDDGTGNTVKVDGKMGCGARFYQNQIAKELSNPDDPSSPKVQPLRVICSNPECGASIRAFPNLTGFKA